MDSVTGPRPPQIRPPRRTGGAGGGAPGPQGPPGPTGPAGPGVPAGGTSGQVLEKTSATDYATAWVTPTGGGGASVHVGPTPPASPAVGDMWWRSDPDGRLFVYYDDGNSTQWVPATPTIKGDPGAAGGAGLSGVWNYKATGGTTDPGNGNIAPDIVGAPTMLRFSTQTTAGADTRNIFLTTAVGDVILAQQQTDSTKWGKFQVSAALIDHTTWFEVPVTVLANGTGGVPANNADVLVDFNRTGTAAQMSYRHVQASAATTWAITHNLSFRPNVAAVDSTGREIWPGAVDYTSATAVQLTFSAAVAGEAYLS